MKPFSLSCIALLLCTYAVPLSAIAIETPVRDYKQLAKPRDEKMLQVTTAKIVIADYPLLRKDFPELHGMNDSEVDQWVLKHAACVSIAQASQEKVNTKIATGEEVDAYRPADYGRAAVFKAGSGLIDAKGVGSVTPAQRDHSNGLATLGESLREFAFEKMVHKVFKHSGVEMDTVGTYAIVDYGFDVVHADGSKSRAGEILRQGHQRFQDFGSLYDDDTSLKLETLLRRYGVSSAGAYHDEPVEKINLQGTLQKNGVLDFGGFLVLDHFDKPAKNFYHSKILISPTQADFVQPDPELRVPFQIWGTTATGKLDPKADNVWVWSHELSDSIERGTASRHDVEQHMRNLLEPVDHILAAHPAKVAPPVMAGAKCDIMDRLANAFK